MAAPHSGNLVLWLEVDTGITTDVDGTVTGWDDQSAANNDLTTSEGDPTTGEVTTPTGQGSVSFDGVEDALKRTGGLALPAGDSDRTVFVVIKYDNAADFAGFAYGTGSNNQTFGLVTSDSGKLTLQGWGGSNDDISDTPATGVGWLVHSVVLENDTYTVFKDGTQIDNGTREFNTTLSQIVLGEENGANEGNVDLDMAAVLVYDRALSEGERAQVDQYLQEKYFTGPDTVDDPPIANADTVRIDDGAPVVIDVLANDFDDGFEGGGLDAGSVEIVDQPDNGSATVNGDGSITYDPSGPTEPDTFTYMVKDTAGNMSGEATVNIEVGKDFSLEGFSNESVIDSGLTAPTAMAFLPDGRMLLTEKGGEVMIVDPESGAKATYLDISGIVNSGQERGLLEIAIHPEFDASSTLPSGDPGFKNWIYLYYTRSADTDSAVIGRFAHQENSGGLSSTAGGEQVLWTDTDGFPGCCHYGGGLDFGPDGKLWLTTSDKFESTNQSEGGSGGDDLHLDLESGGGKIIRINDDGSIPDGTDGWAANPYVDGEIDGEYPSAGVNALTSIWAYGLRNPFRADWDLEREKFYIGEVGGNQGISRDDVHIASLDQKGAFYGWHFYEGVNNVEVSGNDSGDPYQKEQFPDPDTDLADPSSGDYYSAPIYDIHHSSLTGGFVYRGDMFPDAFDGVYFFGNYENNYIKFLDLNASGDGVLGGYDFKPSGEISGNVTNVVFMEEGTDGALYYINYSGTGGQVQRIVYQGSAAAVIDAITLTDNVGDPNDLAGDPDLTVTVAATVSDADTPLNQLSYTVTYGDGNSDTGTPAANGAIDETNTYTQEGVYTVSLAVSDGTRTTFSQIFEVTVGDPNDPPEIVSGGSDVGFGQPGVEVTFTAEVGDPDGDDLTVVFDFDDGSPTVEVAVAGGVATTSHTYNDSGTYNAFFTVSDGEAGPVRSADIPIQVGSTQTVPVTDGLVLDLGDFILFDNDGTVLEWLDKSGSGLNLVSAGDPQFVDNATPSGKPAIAFDGIGDVLFRNDTQDTPLDPLPAGSSARTMFFVVDYEDVTNNEYAGLVYGNGSPGQAFGLTLDGNSDDLTVQGWASADATTDIDGVIDPDTGEQRGFVSHAVTVDAAGNVVHYLNGESIDTATKTYNTVVNKLLVGQNLDGGETPLSAAAAFVYNRELTANEFQAVEDYIQTTYLTAPGDTPPDAVDDGYSATTAQALTVPASTGLLDNDVDDGTLTVTEINGSAVTDGQTVAVANGDLTINADGSFSYTSDPGFAADETFTYTVSDDSAQTDTATVTIAVSPPGSSGLPTDGLVALFEPGNVTTNGSTVENWLSGAGTNMDLINVGGDPTLVQNATPSGAAAVSFDGTDDWLDRKVAQGLDLPDGNDARSMYMVADYKQMSAYAGASYGKGASNNAFGLVVNGGGGDLTVQGWGSGQDLETDVDGIGDNDGSAGDDWFIQSVRFDGSTVRHYKDDQTIATVLDKTFDTILERFVLGEEIKGAGNGEDYDVAAVVVYDKETSDQEHADIIQYLTDTYLAEPNDDPTVSIAALDAVKTEGDAGDTAFTFTVTRAGDTSGTSSVDFAVSGAAVDGADFSGGALPTGTVNFAADETEQTITINVSGDTDVEPDEDFTVTLSNATGATIDTAAANGTIENDDAGTPGGNPVTAGLIAAFESDSGVGTVGGGDNTLTGWTDSSGSANSYDLSGVSGDPQLAAGGTPSGLDAVAFDGGGDFLRINGPTAVAGLPTGSAARTLFFVVDYKTQGEFTGFAYGDDQANEAFGLVTDTAEKLSIEGWAGGTRGSDVEGVNTLGWMVHSVVLDGADYKHFIHTDTGLQLIDSGTDGTFDTDISAGDSALAIAGKVTGSTAGEMDVAAALIYDAALSTGTGDLGGDHALVSQYLYDKYLQAPSVASLSIAPDDAVKAEGDAGDTAFTFTVTRAGDTSGTSSVDFAVSGAAVDGADFSGGALPAGTVNFAADETEQTITINVSGDTDVEPDEDFTVTLSNATGATIDTAPANGTIENDDAVVNPGDPPFASLLALHLESDSGLGGTGGAVTGWEDQSQYENDLTLFEGDPTTGEVFTPSGAASVSFDGDDNLERSGAAITGLPSGSEDRTMFLVANYTASSAYVGAAYGADSPPNPTNDVFGLVTTNGPNGKLAVQGWGGGNDLVSSEVPFDDGWIIQAATVASDDVKHYLNGSELGTFGHTYTTALEKIVLGEEIANGGYADMDIAAVLVYDGALSDPQRQDVREYLQEKYLDASANEPPVAVDDSGAGFTTDEATAFTTANALDNDSDPDTGDTLSVQSIDTTGTLGQVVDNNDGTFGYDPNGQFETLGVGETATDSFAYTVEDGNGGTDTATVTVTVGGVNDDPTAVDDAGAGFTTGAGTAFTTANVLANDSDPDSNDVLAVQSIDTTGTAGQVSDNGNGTFDYTPAAGFAGTDTFTYTLGDGNGGIDEATVTVQVDAAAGPPNAEDEFALTGQSKGVVIDVLANDTDGDGSPFVGVPEITAQPTNGAAVVLPDGRIVYAADSGFENAFDSFDYEIADGGGSDTATVDVFVQPIGNPAAFSLTVGNDTGEVLLGTALNNEIRAAGGDDVVLGGTVGESLLAGTGSDIVIGGGGSDNIFAGVDGDKDLFILSDATASDRINEFDVSDGDALVLVLSDLVNTAGLVDAGRLELVSNPLSGGSVLSADLDGNGSFEANLATLVGVSGVDVEDVVENLLV